MFLLCGTLRTVAQYASERKQAAHGFTVHYSEGEHSDSFGWPSWISTLPCLVSTLPTRLEPGIQLKWENWMYVHCIFVASAVEELLALVGVVPRLDWTWQARHS